MKTKSAVKLFCIFLAALIITGWLSSLVIPVASVCAAGDYCSSTKTKVTPPTRTPIRVTDTPIRVTDTPIRVTDTPIRVTDTPIRVTDTPIRVTDTPIRVTDTPIQVTDTPIRVTDTPIRVTDTPIRVTDTPIQSRTPIRKPVEAEKATIAAPAKCFPELFSTILLDPETNREVALAFLTNGRGVVAEGTKSSPYVGGYGYWSLSSFLNDSVDIRSLDLSWDRCYATFVTIPKAGGQSLVYVVSADGLRWGIVGPGDGSDWLGDGGLVILSQGNVYYVQHPDQLIGKTSETLGDAHQLQTGLMASKSLITTPGGFVSWYGSKNTYFDLGNGTQDTWETNTIPWDVLLDQSSGNGKWSTTADDASGRSGRWILNIESVLFEFSKGTAYTIIGLPKGFKFDVDFRDSWMQSYLFQVVEPINSIPSSY